ncbi:MAG: cupin domain-containing protein [Alphaproteobacteria bacterium]|nr:cupin domain-containing protein [Alphaproteobacteria bacterium]
MTDRNTNLFDAVPENRSDEEFTTLLETGQFKLVRIVSTGQATPDGEWYDQPEAEWVVVLRGRAGLVFEDEPGEHILEEGDFIDIAPRRRHRVSWTDETKPTVWLALHYNS